MNKSNDVKGLALKVLPYAVCILVTAVVTWLLTSQWYKTPNYAAVIPTETPTPTATVMPTAVPAPTQAAWPSTPTSVPTLETADSPSAPDYGLVPQPYVPHPSSYQETGHTGSDADKTITWTIEVLPNTVLIVGGYRVDGEDHGVYKAIPGPAIVTTTVTDGFYSVVKAEWAEAEFCFRVNEAKRYGWEHTHLYPLPGWDCEN